jgi:hypothetical protein
MMNNSRFETEINKISLVIKFSWAEALFYGFFLVYGVFGASAPSYINFMSDIGVEIFQLALLSLFLLLLGIIGWRWGQDCEDLIVITGKDLVIFFVLLILFFGFGYGSLGQSIQGDESAYLMISFGHAIKVLLKFGDYFTILSPWAAKYLIQFISLLLVIGVIIFIHFTRKLVWPKRIMIVLGAFLFCRLLIMYFGGNPSPHPPLAGVAHLVSGAIFGINDFALKSAFFVGYILFIFGIYKMANRALPWHLSFLFALSAGTIPLSLHLAAIVEQSIWSLVCFALIMMELVTKKNPNFIRLASFVAILTLFRQSAFIGYIPILIVFAVSVKRPYSANDRYMLLKLLAPAVIFAPLLIQSLLYGTPSTAALGDQTSQLARVFEAFSSGVILAAIANSVSELWILFIPFAFVFGTNHKVKSVAFLIFFIMALCMFYAISPGLYGYAKYQAEYAIPFAIIGGFNVFLRLISRFNKGMVVLLLLLIITLNITQYHRIPYSNKPVDVLVDTIEQDAKNYNSGYHILSGFPYEFGSAYDEIKRLGLTSNSYTIGVTYGVFLEIVNGYSLGALREAESISRLQKKLNKEASTDSRTTDAIVHIERDPRIKIVVLGAVPRRQELFDGLIRHGWVTHVVYKNNQYGSSVIVMKRVSS